MYKYLVLTLLAISLTATPVQAQIQFQKPEQVPVDENYRWQRQEPGYHGCHCGCRKSKMLAIVPNNSPYLTTIPVNEIVKLLVGEGFSSLFLYL